MKHFMTKIEMKVSATKYDGPILAYNSPHFTMTRQSRDIMHSSSFSIPLSHNAFVHKGVRACLPFCSQFSILGHLLSTPMP